MDSPLSPPKPKLFISHRRDDHLDDSLFLKLSLVIEFGEGNVFFDQSSILPGEEYLRTIPVRVKECDILVVVIGPDWVPLIQRHAIKELDYVRLEIVTALALNKYIVPVRLRDVPLPKEEEVHYQVAKIFRSNVAQVREPRDSLEVKSLAARILQGYGEWRKSRYAIAKLEEYPPAPGLALGYFINFIEKIVPKLEVPEPDAPGFHANIVIRDRKSREKPLFEFDRSSAARKNLKLYIVLPPSLECLAKNQLDTLVDELPEAAIIQDGKTNPDFVVPAWKREGHYQLIDFPRTLGVLNVWLQQTLAKEGHLPGSPKWIETAEEQIQNFEMILRWWIEDWDKGGISRDRVEVIRYTGEQPELEWLGDYWKTSKVASLQTPVGGTLS